MNLLSSQETNERLACSLSGDTIELLPFLPYLLQDFWELGSDPEVMVELIRKHVDISDTTRVLDLACGKGAVSVKIADELGVKVKGIDLTSEFVEYAKLKAQEFSVNDLCEFAIGDINEAVATETDYDCVIYGAVGLDVLGSPLEALNKLKATVKPGGYILIEEGYIPDDGKQGDIRFNKDAYHPLQHWMDLFKEAGFELLETAAGHSEGDHNSETGLAAITKRANELSEMHPDKIALFKEYVRNQQDEYDDIDNNLVCVTWVLRKH
ncbi:MAG: class I SAM-dependent methyltransferase [Coriobacteriia bacterium]|nr:class I SAM-dependent methyltransferase [Coriobacteriia bacterium]